MEQKFTVYGIETSYWTHFSLVSTIRCNSAYHLWYWNDIRHAKYCSIDVKLQQYLPLAVCDEGWETVEARSDDEVRTSLVPDQKDGKTKRIEWKCLPLAVLKRFKLSATLFLFKSTCNSTYHLWYWSKDKDAFCCGFNNYIALTACGIETIHLK